MLPNEDGLKSEDDEAGVIPASLAIGCSTTSASKKGVPAGSALYEGFMFSGHQSVQAPDEFATRRICNTSVAAITDLVERFPRLNSRAVSLHRLEERLSMRLPLGYTPSPRGG